MLFDRKSNCLIFNAEAGATVKPDAVKEILEYIKSQDENFFSGIKFVAYNCSQVNLVAAMCFPVMCRISSFLEQNKISFSLVGSSKVTDIIFKQGIERMIIPVASLEAFYKNANVSNEPKREVVKEFLNTTLDSVVSSLKVMLEAKVLATEVVTVTRADQLPLIQIGASAGIISTHFNGNLIIAFSNDDFKVAMTKFLQMEVSEITPDIRDGVAELLNVIIGQTKIILNDRGFDIQLVIPNVISGDNINILPPNKQKSILVNFKCDFGKFCILLTTNIAH